MSDLILIILEKVSSKPTTSNKDFKPVNLNFAKVRFGENQRELHVLRVIFRSRLMQCDDVVTFHDIVSGQLVM